MFSLYVDKAMHSAVYEALEDGTFFGSLSGFDGVSAIGQTVEDCREELRGALEDWLVLGLWMNDEAIPKLGKLDLVPRKLSRANKAAHESAPETRTRKAS